MTVIRFDIFMAQLPEIENSSVQQGCRPVIVVSNDSANAYSRVISVVPLTSKLKKAHLPTHVFLNGHGLTKNSIALCEQILSLDKRALIRRIGSVADDFAKLSIEHALAVQLGVAA